MQVTETNNEGLKRSYKVVVPAEEIKIKIDNRLSEIAKTASMPGFRPGKVPVTLLKKTHGQAIMGEILEKTVNESSQKALSDKDLRPVAQPKIEIDKFDEGSDLEYTIQLELFPEIKLTEFKKIKLERFKVPANEDQIDEILGQMADGQKDSKPLKKTRPVASGDLAVIDFVGSVDGEEFAGGSAENYSLEIGSGSFIPGFEEQIIGKNIGDKFDVNVTFPDEYAKELAGKDAIFAVELKDHKETIPGTVNDEMAIKMGAENLEDLRNKLKENQEAELGQYSRLRVKRELLDILDKEHQFEMPDGMVEAEFEAIWQQFEQQRKDHPEKIEEEDKNKTDDQLKEEYRVIALRRVKLGLLLAEIGRVNEISVSQEEVNRAIVQEAQQYKGKEKEVFDYYKNNPEAMQGIQSPLLEEKVVDFVIELSDVHEKIVTVDELMAEPEIGKKAQNNTDTDKKTKKKSSSKKNTARKKNADKA